MKNSIKCWIWDNVYVKVDVRVGNHCFTTGKCRGSTHRDCNTNVKLYHRIPVAFHNLKNYHSHLIIQELGKFNFRINVIPNEMEIYMSFSINKLSFIDSYQFISFLLDSFI